MWHTAEVDKLWQIIRHHHHCHQRSKSITPSTLQSNRMQTLPWRGIRVMRAMPLWLQGLSPYVISGARKALNRSMNASVSRAHFLVEPSDSCLSLVDNTLRSNQVIWLAAIPLLSLPMALNSAGWPESKPLKRHRHLWLESHLREHLPLSHAFDHLKFSKLWFKG